MKSHLLLVIAFAIAITTNAQVTLLSNNTNLEMGFPLNGKALLISNNDSIWTSDGTPGGTYKLLDNVSYADSGGVIYNNFFFFTGVTTTNGAELWKTDGTVAGTQLVKDINPGTSSSGPSDFTIFNNRIFFTANDGVNGRELWTTDGTAAGTQLFKDINAGAPSSLPLYPHITLAGNYMYFIANDGTHGEELWKTDGTSPGTSMVADLTPGSASTDFFWDPFAVLGNSVLFTDRNSSDFSFNLWISDGTTAGTTLIKNFGNFSTLSAGASYYKFNNKIYFTTGGTTQYGNLWVTDGTASGTSLIKQDIFTMISNAVTINNKFYFAGTSAAEGGELWVSDGTAAGTTLLKQVFPPSASSFAFILQPFDLTNGYNSLLFHGKFFYIVINNTDYQLWISDGTLAGTSKVTDMNTVAGSDLGSGLSYYYTAQGLYFTANKGAGIEPWFTDGTVAGTQSVADINPGIAASNPYYMFIYNNKLFFSANNGDNTVINTDLYILGANVTVLPVTLLEFAATKMPGAIHVQWDTRSEVNIDYYQVERSVDGANFTNIGKVKAIAGYSNSQTYSLDDKEALTLNQPVIYYRLRMVENNGSFKYSTIVKIDFSNAAFTVNFSPNPVTNTANLTINGVHSGNLQIEIIDLSGRTLRQMTKAVTDGVIQLPLDVSGLAPGSYLLRIINENNQKVQQFIKQ